jgi:hypothetical protein
MCKKCAVHYVCMCGEAIAPMRYKLGFKTCLACGEVQAKQVRHTVAPMHKSNYILITDRDLLVGLNNKTIR